YTGVMYRCKFYFCFMAAGNENILDRFDEELEKQWFHHWLVVYGPVGLFIVGVVFRFMKWPFSSLILVAALSAMVIRSFIFFFSKKRRTSEWFYFLGRIAFTLLLILMFGG